jgi:hypothetical protein
MPDDLRRASEIASEATSSTAPGEAAFTLPHPDRARRAAICGRNRNSRRLGTG